MNKMKFKIQRAKESALGRFFCRLLGDQGGAVMMEYVVLGVLVVAAAVAIVMVFGDAIHDQFSYMIDVLTVGPTQAKQNLDNRRAARKTGSGSAQNLIDGTHFNDVGAGPGGGGGGGGGGGN